MDDVETEEQELAELPPEEVLTGQIDIPPELDVPQEDEPEVVAEPLNLPVEPPGVDDGAVMPSEVFEGFLGYLETCKEEYQVNMQEVWRHDKALQDDVHAFELAESNEDAAQLGVEFRHKRIRRRACKDAAQLYEKGAAFLVDERNRAFLERIRRMTGEQKRQEEYLLNPRHYNRRGDDG